MVNDKSFVRNCDRLCCEHFDVLVIGGGINGVAVAWDAALRGMKVALIEKNDFSSGASSGCFKIAHGGIRYLQHLDLRRLKESAHEQRLLRILAAHFVRPFPFLFPCYGYGKRSRLFLRFGMFLYELLTLSRNHKVGETHVLPRHQVLSKSQCLNIAPNLPQEGLRGGVVFYDCQISNCERLTLSVAKAAVRAGAVVCNYVEALSAECQPVGEGGFKISNVRALDRERGREILIRAERIVNATGPWMRNTLDILGVPAGNRDDLKEKQPFSKGVQIVIPGFVRKFGLALESHGRDAARVIDRGGRSYFVFPWRGMSLVGTTDSIVDTEPDDFSIPRNEVEYLFNEVKEMYSLDSMDASEVKFAFGGLRPIDKSVRNRIAKGKEVTGSATVSREDRVINHYLDKKVRVHNLVTVEGVKYTTFRALAERAVDVLVKRTPFAGRRSVTNRDILPGGDVGNYRRFMTRIHDLYDRMYTSEVVDYLLANYGSDVEDIFRLVEMDPSLGEHIMDSPPLLRAEVLWMARQEMVCKLSDVVLRRAGCGLTGYPGDQAIYAIGGMLASELGWSQEKLKMEIEDIKAEYTRMGFPLSS